MLTETGRRSIVFAGRRAVSAGFALSFGITLALIAGGCELPAEADWPVQRVVGAPASLARLINLDDIGHFERALGVRIRFEWLEATGVLPRLRSGPAADMVLIGDAALWEQLETSGLAAEERWRFRFRRDHVALVSADPSDAPYADPPAILADPPLPLMSADLDLARDGRLVAEALDAAGLLRPLRPLLNIVQRSDSVLQEMRAGRARGAFCALSRALEAKPGLNLLATLDPHPGLPPELAGAVLNSAPDRLAAHHLWNYIERRLREPRWGLIPIGGPTPAAYANTEGVQ